MYFEERKTTEYETSKDKVPLVVHILDYLSTIDHINIKNGIYDAQESLTARYLNTINFIKELNKEE